MKEQSLPPIERRRRKLLPAAGGAPAMEPFFVSNVKSRMDLAARFPFHRGKLPERWATNEMASRLAQNEQPLQSLLDSERSTRRLIAINAPPRMAKPAFGLPARRWKCGTTRTTRRTLPRATGSGEGTCSITMLRRRCGQGRTREQMPMGRHMLANSQGVSERVPADSP